MNSSVPQPTEQEPPPSNPPPAGDILEPVPKWPEEPAWSLERLWAEGAMPTRWIVEPLIAEGHQVILAGEPKAGKSLLASQLCLEIAKGPGQLLQISLPGVASAIRPGEKLPPGAFRVATRNGATLKSGKVPAEAANGQKWKVLYVSFEMSPQVMWARTSQQATGMKAALLLGKPKPNPMPAPALDAMPPANYVPGTFPSAHGFFHLFDLMGEKDLGLMCFPGNNGHALGVMVDG